MISGPYSSSTSLQGYIQLDFNLKYPVWDYCGRDHDALAPQRTFELFEYFNNGEKFFLVTLYRFWVSDNFLRKILLKKASVCFSE